MSLKSVFGLAEKGVNLDKFPKPPTLREMMEDIEVCTSDDPVIILAELLQRKGSGIDSEESTDLSNGLGETGIGSWLSQSLAAAAMRELNLTPAQYAPKSPLSPSSLTKDSNSQATTPNPTVDLHTKIKKFSTICSKSEDLISKVEGNLRDLEAGCQEILQDSSPGPEDSLT